MDSNSLSVSAQGLVLNVAATHRKLKSMDNDSLFGSGSVSCNCKVSEEDSDIMPRRFHC